MDMKTTENIFSDETSDETDLKLSINQTAI